MTDGEWAYERTLVLADDADLAALVRYAGEHGWVAGSDLPGGYDYLRQIGWEVAESVALWVESGRLGVRFVSVAGPSADQVAALAGDIAVVLPVATEEATLAELTAERPADPVVALRAVHRLAAQYEIRRLRGLPTDPEDRYRLMAERTIDHPDQTVRHALLFLFADLMEVRPEVVGPILAAHRQGGRDQPEIIEAFAAIAEDKGVPVG